MELACRSRQELYKWLERTSIAGHKVAPHDSLFIEAGSDPILAHVHKRLQQHDFTGVALWSRDWFCETVAPRFFEGTVCAETPVYLGEYFRETLDHIVAAAEEARRGRFCLLGYPALSFGDPVDWHLDPLSGRRAPLAHWSHFDPPAPELVGDCKVVWELNRHQWLVHLGQAYHFTRDERYTWRFSVYVRDWLLANPSGMGINWASSLEVALRLISWCWALTMFRGAKTLAPELFEVMLNAIWIHASHVERYLSSYSSPNTHLTGEALGLLYAGIIFSDLRKGARWREQGIQILLEESERQILPDGTYFEQSTCYQRYTVEIYLHFLILAARNGIPIPPSLPQRVQRLCDVLLALRRPDGSMPQIGDADGGWLMPLSIRTPDDCRGIFSTAAALFHRSDYAWAAGGLAPETLWLLGPSAVRTFAMLSPAPPSESPSRVFQNGGYVVMRSTWEEDAHHLILDAGPLGCPISGAHGHADLLSIQCSVFGEPCIVDPGMSGYAAHHDWREFFRSSAAHSTVMIDRVSQATPEGPFAWKSRPQARLLRWRSTATYDLADAVHHGYCRLPDPVVHRRRVVFMKPRGWIVVDDLEGQAEHLVEVLFQFLPVPVILDQTGWARVHGGPNHELLVRTLAAIPLSAALHEGGLTPVQGWYSADYGQRRPAPLLSYSTVARLPLRVVTLLLPSKKAGVRLPVVSLGAAEGSVLVELVFEDWQDTIEIGEQDIVHDSKELCAPL